MQIKNWIKTHKIATAGILIGIIVVVSAISTLMVSMGAKRTTYEYAGLSPAPVISYKGSAPASEAERTVSEPFQVKGEIEVKEGSMEIESKDAETDFGKIQSITQNYDGYVERSSKSIGNLYVRINLTLRVSSEQFTDLIEKLKKDFEVKSYDVENYRIPIEKELDELQILKESLSDYQEIRGEIKEMKVGKDKIDLLMEVTDKELVLKQKEGGYQREISGQERRGEYATLNVSLYQKKSPKIWPEDVLDQFKDRLRGTLDKVVEILKDLVGGSIELLFRTIQIAAYVFIVGIILAGAYRVGRKLFELLIKK